MRIIIEKLNYGWNVIMEEKYSDQLSWDEMLGLVASLTMPDNKICTQWLKTKAEHRLHTLYSHADKFTLEQLDAMTEEEYLKIREDLFNRRNKTND